MAASTKVRRSGIGVVIATVLLLAWVFLPERVRRWLDRIDSRRRHRDRS